LIRCGDYAVLARAIELAKKPGGSLLLWKQQSDIAEAIGEIKRAGYDVFLVLEATIGFNKRGDGEEGDEDDALSEPQELETNGKVRFTTQDQRFLKALRITVDEEA